MYTKRRNVTCLFKFTDLFILKSDVKDMGKDLGKAYIYVFTEFQLIWFHHLVELIFLNTTMCITQIGQKCDLSAYVIYTQK